MIKRYTTFLIYAFMFFVLISCSSIETIDSSKRKMNYPIADYTGMGWISQKELAAFVEDKRGFGSVVGYFLENNNFFYNLNLPLSVPELDCKNDNDVAYFKPHILPNGLLGLINTCITPPLSLDPAIKHDYMVAYDFQTQKVEILVKQPLPNYLSNGYTWSPDMKLGLMQIYGGLNGTIYWMSYDKIEPVDFAISDGESTFFPANDFPRFKSNSETQGIVFSPAWSPDGKTIAFFVTLDSIGKRGFSRAEGKYKIFFMDPNEQKPYSVIEGINNPSAPLVWSPDNKWLAFVGEYGTFETRGLWLYSVDSDKIFFIDGGDFDVIAWSPDGKTIAATLCDPNNTEVLCEEYEIWEYDVSSIYE